MNIREALRRTLELVESSRPSGWAAEGIAKIAEQLRAAIATVDSGAPLDRSSLSFLFAPTGDIQETSIDNGWGDEFLSLSEVVDTFLADRERS